ncbi:unnamed protein product [Cylicostephanus goldi]|uniref:Uncharacterized protein n=1 Tax=Cylicostephanus goldi TaxID=71465 RepID=A0A3P7MZG0_CYLGO|nr:unnamed protein product [Cylicostephanus goldi]
MLNQQNSTIIVFGGTEEEVTPFVRKGQKLPRLYKIQDQFA